MPDRNTSLSDYLAEAQAGQRGIDPDLAALIGHIETACRRIALAVSRHGLDPEVEIETAVNVQGEVQKPLDVIANRIMIETCEAGGQLCGMVSEELEAFYPIPARHARGAYLLLFDPLDGSSGIGANTTVGSIFSVLRASSPGHDAAAPDFLQSGHRQVAAGYALYGPSTMLVISLGQGVHGFTLDHETGAFRMTHPLIRVPQSATDFAINASNAQVWEQPISRYIEECVSGQRGPRGRDFNMRWLGAMVTEVHRVLLRGGVYLYPRDTKTPVKAGRLRLLYEASPMAMLVEQAGGAASTGRRRLLDVVPSAIHERVPVILGCREEVERLVDYHAAFDRGEPSTFEAPLFNHRSLFRSA